MVIRDWITTASQKLSSITDVPLLEARLLAEYVIGCSSTSLFMKSQEEFAQQARADALLNRRLQHEPMAYLLGHKEFMSLDFLVTPDVLIPRGDTECLVEELIQRYQNQALHFLEIGTGSGCISVSLAYYLPNATITAIDISEEALSIAAQNAAVHKVNSQITFLKQDIRKEFPKGTFSCIVSNPPYIESEVIDTLSPDVKQFEPLLALDGGTDGLDFYRRIISVASSRLFDDGCIAFEMGFQQKEAISSLLQQHAFQNILVKKDLQGLSRCIFAQKG